MCEQCASRSFSASHLHQYVMPRAFSSKLRVHHIWSHGTEMRPKTHGKACKAIQAFPRGQSLCQDDLTLSPYAFEKLGTSVAVNSRPRRAFSARSAPRGEAEAIRRRAELADGMSEAGGRPDVPEAWPELRFLAIRRPSLLVGETNQSAIFPPWRITPAGRPCVGRRGSGHDRL